MGNWPARQGATRTCRQAGAIVACGPRDHARHSCARLTCHASRRLAACGAARCERSPLERVRNGRQLRQRPRTAPARAVCLHSARLGSMPGTSVCCPPRQRVYEDDSMREPSATGLPVNRSCRHLCGHVVPGRRAELPERFLLRFGVQLGPAAVAPPAAARGSAMAWSGPDAGAWPGQVAPPRAARWPWPTPPPVRRLALQSACRLVRHNPSSPWAREPVPGLTQPAVQLVADSSR